MFADIDLYTKPIRRDLLKGGLTWEDMGNRILVTPGFVLNETASLIWRLSDGKNSIKEIHERLCSEYVIKDEQKKRDVLTDIISFIKEAEKRSLLIEPSAE